MAPSTAPPLLVSADERVILEIQRSAAAAGVTVTVTPEPVDALRRWAAASLVLIGADRAEALADLSPPRRDAVHLVGEGPGSDQWWRFALRLGAESVASLPDSRAWLVETLTDAGDGSATPGRTVAVLGGSGGAGASIFAVALAQVSATWRPTLLVDADPWGAGLDRVLGVEHAPGIRWDALGEAHGRLSARSLREALPRAGDLSVLAWAAERPTAVAPDAMREVLSAGRRGFGAVVVDIGRCPGVAAEETLSRCDDVLVVCALTVAGVAAAARVAARVRSDTAGLITRGAQRQVRPEEAARILGLPLVASMRDQRGLDEGIDLGAGPLRSPRGELAQAAQHSAAALFVEAVTA